MSVANRLSIPGVADEAMSEADGAGGGPNVAKPTKGKSRRKLNGDSRRDKASGEASGAVPDVTR